MLDGAAFHVGVLVQANHGIRPWFTVLGPCMMEDRLLEAEQGSIIAILATDLPLAPHQLARLAKRAAIGIGRGGTPGGNNSGDIFLAFSTANRGPLPQLAALRRDFVMINDEAFDPICLAAVEGVEEAVINAMLAADDMTTGRPPGHVCRALDGQRLMELLA